MWPILVGIETEYGLTLDGRGAADQIDDAMALVRGTPDGRFVGWDYRFESPRSDLRGYQVSKLSIDPEDAKFDQGKSLPPDKDVRSDRILANGGRFYNDHGHPEIATPECWSVEELALQDKVGEQIVQRAAKELERTTGRDVRVYKNNTDGHGSSYGTHESYLVPRSLNYQRLSQSLLPLLIARQVVCGAGKVGAESGTACDFQLSQRADFLTETSSVDTLYRRPIFNTRDEPHADPSAWARLHVISGDANRILSATARKVALIKLGLWLEAIGECPNWQLVDPVRSLTNVSRDVTCSGRILLEGNNWTTPRQIIESYVEAAEKWLDVKVPHVCEALSYGRQSIELLDDWAKGGPLMAREVDWAAKLQMLTEYVESEGTEWSDPALRSFDLAYHSLEPGESLFEALQEAEMLDAEPDESVLVARTARPQEQTRAFARSVAVCECSDSLVGVSWGTLTFEIDGERRAVGLPPDLVYPKDLETARSSREFVARMEALT